jgi:hypothetical protein
MDMATEVWLISGRRSNCCLSQSLSSISNIITRKGLKCAKKALLPLDTNLLLWYTILRRGRIVIEELLNKGVMRMGPGEQAIIESIESAYETIAESEAAIEAVVSSIESADDDDD